MKTISLILVLFLSVTMVYGNMSNFPVKPFSNSDSLVAFYPFNGNANDESGNGHHGSVSGATSTTDRFNQPDKGYNFVYNGYSSDKIQVNGTSELNFSAGGFTLSAWVKFSGPANEGYNYPIFSKHICGEQSGYILMLYNGKLTFWLAGSGGYNVVGTSDDYTDNSWHQVVAVYDGTTQYIYVDGALKNSMPFSYNSFNSANWALGGYNGCNGGFNGKADEIKVFNQALTGSEIMDMYKKSTNDLVAFLPFNGNTVDESGNGHDGTVNGGILTEDRNNNLNSAYTFPNLHNQIVLANTTNLILQGGFSLNAWVKYKNINCGIVGKHNCWTPNGFLLGIEDGQFALWISNEGWQIIKTNETYKENNWYMVTAVYDSVNKTGLLYIDGRLKSSGNAVYSNFNAANLTISEASGGCPSGNMPGAIDEVKIFGRSLSADEIFAEYNATQTGLVAFYPFNGNANDVSGNSLHGTIDGATLTTDRSGNVNSAYLFDGNDIITIAYNDKLNADQELAISVWVKPDVLHDALILGKSNWYTQTNYLIRTKSTGFIQFEYRDMAYNTDNPLIVGQWNHIAVVSDAGNSKKVYINGVLASHTGGVSPFYMVPEVLTIGGASYGSEYFNGAIDDLRIYRTTLSESDILNLYYNTTLEIEKTQGLTLCPYFVFNNSLHLKNQQNSNNVKTIEVYNLLGQKVLYTSKITEPISLNGLQKGVYILKVLNKNGKRNVLKFSFE